MTAPRAPYEAVPVHALRGYGLLDIRPEPAFDDLTALAASSCGAPISLLGLVTTDGVWFKSQVGLDVEETSRQAEFWTYVISRDELFIVPDVLKDERFASEPLFTGQPSIRFYAGVPLVSAEGYQLGALCVLDRVPRGLSPESQEALRSLAGLAVAQIELRRTAQTLAESERRFQSIMGEANQAYISFDTGGVIREWNREAERLLGWTRDEIIGSSARETVVPADLWARVITALSERVMSDHASPVATRVDGTAITKPGLELPVEFTFLPTKVGESTHINVLLHDISARTQVAIKRERLLRAEISRGREVGAKGARLLAIEQQAGIALTSQNERLHALDALRNQFISVVSHELRTPLSAIRGYLEIVLGEEPGPLNEEQRKFLRIADASSEQLLRVVGDLLLIGKTDSGQFVLVIGEIDLRSMLEACLVRAQPAAEAKHIDLRLTSGEMPPFAGDSDRLSQALDNIISNAVKFTRDGDVDVRLHLKADRAVIEIVDTGTGVPQAEVENLFVPFFRASNAMRQAIPGTGLGLSIAKGIIEAHGGSISVESKLGSGSSFRVELPMKKTGQ